MIVDVQIGLAAPEYGRRCNPRFLLHVEQLLGAWRTAGLAVVFTRHVSSRPGSPLAPGADGLAIEPRVAPASGEPVFDKRTNSAFKQPRFAAALAPAPAELVVVGLATDACVTATAREALDLGYRVTVVHDACSTYERRAPAGETLPAELVHDVALAALAASGIRLRSTADQLADLAPTDP
ncbi:isochorismatase family protein [Rubrivivax gelatinosus]|uniref:isochorismatase family protein n=1 Tax=Rubrivivax gelatinosus TaxID=28068 RepID=UPI003A7FA89D